MTLFLALVVMLIPLAIAPGYFFYFDVTPKTVILLLGTAAAAIWWAVKGAGLSRESRYERWFLWAIGAMAVSLAVSTVFSVDRGLSLCGSSWRYWGIITQMTALGFAALVALWCAGRHKRLLNILRAIAAAGLITALYGIAQYFGWDPWLDERGYHSGEGIYTIVRPPSTLGHADYFANWLLFAVFAAVALLLFEEAARWKWLARFSVAAGAIAIVLSGTRAAMLGLLAGALFLLLWRGLRINRMALIVALAAMVAGGVFYISPAGGLLRARVHWALQEPAGGARFLLWRDSLLMAQSRWPFGYGPETYIAQFALHQSAELSRAYPDFYHESPHNIFIDALVSQGVAGPVLLGALCAIGFASAWKARANASAGALAAGLLGMTISEQFASFMLPTALAYYLAIAMLASLASTAAPRNRLARARWIRLAVAVPCAAVLTFFGVRLWMAETALAAARRDLDAYQVGDANSRYEEYQRWRWPGSSADLWYSRRLAEIASSQASAAVRFQAFQTAGLAAQRATESGEAPFNAYYNLAPYYARLNDFPNTERCLRAAIAHAPNWFKPHWMLAQVLLASSRLQEAQTEGTLAAGLDGGAHPEVTSTLERVRIALKSAPMEPPHK